MTKNANDVVATSTITKTMHVVLQNKEELTYPYEIKGTKGEYTRMLVAFGDLDSKTMFGSQVFFLLNPKQDSAYPAIYKANPADRGTLTIEIINAIIRYGVADNGTDMYKTETTVHVIKFDKE